MKANGYVHKYGDNVDTDVIIPARYLNMADHKELASHCMEDIDKEFVNKVSFGDIMVGMANFGCGSSREHAPIAIKAERTLVTLNITIRMKIIGSIVSTVYLPRTVRVNRMGPEILTPSMRMTATPKIFFPSVCPFLKSIGTRNSNRRNAINVPNITIINDRLKIM